jgi:basic membrane protein A and related proteins
MDQDGMQEGSFNANAYAGIQEAIARLGIAGQHLVSQQPSDYPRNIQQLLDQDMDLIVIIGSQPDDELAVAAQAHPDRKFAIVEDAFPVCSPGEIEGPDCGPMAELPNVRHLAFQIDEAAFLAGYLAAGMTKTGLVGTYGTINTPSVTAFMGAFEAGVEYYNTIHAASVQVKGGLSQPGGGLFTGSLDSIEAGFAYAHSLLMAGVDIIMPVSGSAGQGSAATCKETGLCLIIGVNTDWYISFPEYREVQLTSVIKRLDVAVYDTINDTLEGWFTGGRVVYTISEGAVDLAPFHELDAKIPDSLRSEIEALKVQLSNGTLTIDNLPEVQQ